MYWTPRFAGADCKSNEKHTSYCAMMKLGMPVPRTMLIPPKEYDESPDLQVTLDRYAQLFDLAQIGRGGALQTGYAALGIGRAQVREKRAARHGGLGDGKLGARRVE